MIWQPSEPEAAMEIGGYKFHRRASAAFHQLPSEEQDQLLDALAGSADTPVALNPSPWVRRLPSDQPLYLVRVNPNLRVILSMPDGQPPEVQDVVRREALESFARRAAATGS